MKALVKLFNLKVKHGMSDSCFSDVLLLIGDLLSEDNNIPSSFSEAKKTLCALGMGINEDETSFRICKAFRWKLNKKREEQEGVPAKVLWYFPLIPRIRNLFNTPQIVKDMTWHDTERQKDGKIRHPADSETWKDVDKEWPDFALDRRNLQLALSSDGFNPFHGNRTDYSSWPATRLVHYRKTVVMRHRRWLPRHHPYRKQKTTFDNTVEKDVAPIPLTGEQTQRQPRWKKGEARPVWKKVSIFFQLEYWKFLPVRHVLDVMHIEKNICEALLGTLLNIPRKTKDRESVHLDMADMGIRMELRPKTPGKKEKVPLASWNLSNAEKKVVCSSFLQMKLPDGFCSNIKNLVNMEKLRLGGMKSHDCHTILHHLLPISIRSVLQKQVSEHMASLMVRYQQHENDQVWLKNKQNDQFAELFKKKIATELLQEDNTIGDEIRWIAEGPNKNVPTFSGYRIKGVSYSTKDCDDNRLVQCSGVSIVADTLMLVEKDKNVEQTAHTYYGVITSIWKLDYNNFRVPIFCCNWVDINKGVKVDDLGFILVNLNKLEFEHVKQVCYIDDPLDKFWYVVLNLPEKNFHDHCDEENDGSVEVELENDLHLPLFPNVDEHDDENTSYMREEEEWIQLP
ncbi:uncharacterized protein LOC141709517 [Apium graveolens]|uniref:uncharacterized protein LOC141709517 n=1 Tax=Apium graveolens TaxID=4045 RepID=UPI003D78C83F